MISSKNPRRNNDSVKDEVNIGVEGTGCGQVKFTDQSVNWRRMKASQQELEIAPHVVLEQIKVTWTLIQIEQKKIEVSAWSPYSKTQRSKIWKFAENRKMFNVEAAVEVERKVCQMNFKPVV